MPIIKTGIEVLKTTGDYSIITNVPFSDPNLSFKAKGVLIYLLTKKENWIIHVQDLMNNSTNGRDSVYSALRELREFGYAELKTKRKDGRIIRKYWSVTDRPTLKRVFRNRESLIKKTRTVSKDLIINKDRKYSAQSAERVNGFISNGCRNKKTDPSPNILVSEFHVFLIKHNLHLDHFQLRHGTSSKIVEHNEAILRKWEKSAANLILQYQDKGGFEHIWRVMRWWFLNRRTHPFVTKTSVFTKFAKQFLTTEKAWAETTGNDLPKEEKKIEDVPDDDKGWVEADPEDRI